MSKFQQCPQGFEPYLRQHPRDIVHRVAAIFYYSDPSKHELPKLRYHTLALIRIDPNISEILFFNTSYLLFSPSYGCELAAALRQQERNGRMNTQGYWVMARVLETIALPPLSKDNQGRAFYYRWFSIPAGSSFRTSVDIPTAIEAIKCFRLSLASPSNSNDDFFVSDSSLELAKTLDEIGRPELACAICQKALHSNTRMDREDMLLRYGISLHDDHQDQSALSVLGTVQMAEMLDGGGLGGDAVSAQMEEGLIALDHGDIAGANQHLVSEAKEAPGIRADQVGLPLTLAIELLKYGQNDTVAAFCRSALQICPGQAETVKLLQRATAN